MFMGTLRKTISSKIYQKISKKIYKTPQNIELCNVRRFFGLLKT